MFSARMLRGLIVPVSASSRHSPSSLEGVDVVIYAAPRALGLKMYLRPVLLKPRYEVSKEYECEYDESLKYYRKEGYPDWKPGNDFNGTKLHPLVLHGIEEEGGLMEPLSDTELEHI